MKGVQHVKVKVGSDTVSEFTHSVVRTTRIISSKNLAMCAVKLARWCVDNKQAEIEEVKVDNDSSGWSITIVYQ